MGYVTYVTGEFAITPPLTWNEFKDSKFAPHNATSRHEPSLLFRVAEDSVDTDEGTLLRRTATALVMRQIDEYRERGLVAEVQEAIDAFPGREWTGWLECEGEENTDMWRVVIRDGRAIRVEPRIVWPDEDEVPEVTPVSAAEEVSATTWDGGHALVIEYGDCEFYARCQCHADLGGPLRPDQPWMDVFGLAWERHVMAEARS